MVYVWRPARSTLRERWKDDMKSDSEGWVREERKWVVWSVRRVSVNMQRARKSVRLRR